jgi:hypothetical protein
MFQPDHTDVEKGGALPTMWATIPGKAMLSSTRKVGSKLGT